MVAEKNAARRVDHQPASTCIQTGIYYRARIAALCTNTGDQQWNLRGDGTHRPHFFRIRRSHHKHAIAGGVPLLADTLGNSLPQGPPFYLQILKLTRTCVRGAAEKNARLVFTSQERLQRLSAEI